MSRSSRTGWHRARCTMSDVKNPYMLLVVDDEPTTVLEPADKDGVGNSLLKETGEEISTWELINDYAMEGYVTSLENKDAGGVDNWYRTPSQYQPVLGSSWNVAAISRSVADDFVRQGVSRARIIVFDPKNLVHVSLLSEMLEARGVS